MVRLSPLIKAMTTKCIKLGRFFFCLVLMTSGLFSTAHASATSDKAKVDQVLAQSQSPNPDSSKPLIPIPEPSAASLVLLSLGGLGLTLVMRKQA